MSTTPQEKYQAVLDSYYAELGKPKDERRFHDEAHARRVASLETGWSQNPSAYHIPPAKNVARCVKGFPWAAAGYRMWLLMLRGEERITESGIVLPDVAGARGKDKELTTGMCVAHGPGEVVSFGQYVSPEHDFNVTIGEIVFISANCGEPAGIEDEEYRIIAPFDLVGVARRDGRNLAARKKLLERLGKSMEKLDSDRDRSLVGTSPSPVPAMNKPDYELEQEEVLEMHRSEKGTPSRSSFPMDPSVPKIQKE